MISDPTPEALRHALAGHEPALGALIDRLTPLIQVRVARVLLRRATGGDGGRLRQELEDLVQEVLLALFADGGKVLRNWQRDRGLSFANYVGLVTERRVASILRSGKKTWREALAPTESLDGPAPGPGVERDVASRDTLRRLLGRLRDELSPTGWQMFELLFVHERTVDEVRAATGMSAAAIYAWRSRLRRRAQALRQSTAPEIAGSRRIS